MLIMGFHNAEVFRATIDSNTDDQVVRGHSGGGVSACWSTVGRLSNPGACADGRDDTLGGLWHGKWQHAS